jgi:hypothetical protein
VFISTSAEQVWDPPFVLLVGLVLMGVVCL